MFTLRAILNNASLAAFIGAAAAFMLVAATDWRRRRRKATKVIPMLLRRLETLTQNRQEGIASVLAALDSGAPATRYYALRFPVERIERYSENVADSLSTAQASALDNLVFYMREADKNNDRALERLEEVEQIGNDSALQGEKRAQRIKDLIRHVRRHYSEENTLHGKIRETISAYLSGNLTEGGGPPP